MPVAMARLLQNVVVSRHPFEYDVSGLRVSGYTRMPIDRLTEIIRPEHVDRKRSVQDCARDRNFMTDIDWMSAQLMLYGIDTQKQREEPWLLPETLEHAFDNHLLDEPTDSVKVLEAKLDRKYKREVLRRIHKLLDRYSNGSSQHKELEQIRRSIRKKMKQDRRKRQVGA